MRLQVWPLFGLQDPQLWYPLEKGFEACDAAEFRRSYIGDHSGALLRDLAFGCSQRPATTAKASTAAKPATKEPRSPRGSSNRSYGSISNIMKTKHDTVKNSISNVR
jgi:hypothetical protein